MSITSFWCSRICMYSSPHIMMIIYRYILVTDRVLKLLQFGWWCASLKKIIGVLYAWYRKDGLYFMLWANIVTWCLKYIFYNIRVAHVRWQSLEKWQQSWDVKHLHEKENLSDLYVLGNSNFSFSFTAFKQIRILVLHFIKECDCNYNLFTLKLDKLLHDSCNDCCLI